ncbi:hypothetical protein A2U01_0078939, partial [Trifolium medium]|nr:hypothetical protein [Trifolium medium]
ATTSILTMVAEQAAGGDRSYRAADAAN